MRLGWALLVLCLRTVSATDADADVAVASHAEPCGTRETCGACLRHPTCAWCSQPDHPHPRCFSEGAPDSGCSEEYVYSPGNVLTILQNLRGNSLPRPVLISPQKVSMQLRAGQPLHLRMTYTQPEERPLDLYYLMDVRGASAAERRSMAALGAALAAGCANLTSSLRLGAGLVYPEAGAGGASLFNSLSLGLDTQDFVNAVEHASFETEARAAKAVLQVVTSREVGWRTSATKLLVFATGTQFIEGIDASNLRRNSIGVIFAVTREQISVYEEMRAHIEGAIAAVLTEDSSNIVEIVKGQYNNRVSSVEMKDTSRGVVEMKYRSSCLGGGGGGGEGEEISRCNGLMVGDEVDFEAEITVTECPANRSKWTQNFQIYPIGVNASLAVELQMLCECPR